MKLQKILRILSENKLSWRRVNNQPCVHAFYGDYYINLCLWHPNGVKTISIDVDDIKRNVSDILAEDLSESNIHFSDLSSVYNQAKQVAINIAA